MTSNEKIDQAVYDARSKFWEAAKASASHVMDETPALWKGADANLYRAEKRIIMKHLEPIYTGAFIASFFFVTFRVSGSRWYARFRETHFASTSSVRSIQTPGQPTTKQWKSFLEKKREDSKAMENDLVQLPVDIVLSILCGCSSIVWLSKSQELHKDFAELPLVSGVSVIHRHACQDFENAYQKVDKKIFESNKQDEILKTFHIFVQNCRIRSEFIRAREVDGSALPALIPYPGLKGIQR